MIFTNHLDEETKLDLIKYLTDYKDKSVAMSAFLVPGTQELRIRFLTFDKESSETHYLILFKTDVEKLDTKE